MDKKRRHLIIFGFIAAIMYILWKLILSLLVQSRIVSHLEWALLGLSFGTLVIGEMGIFTGRRYGFYIMTLFLLSMFIETILVEVPAYISFPIFLGGNIYLAFMYRIQTNESVQ